jgi:osmotically-inducible protein OsmY
MEARMSKIANTAVNLAAAAALMIGALVIVTPSPALFGQDTQPDNSRMNQSSANNTTQTAERQKNNKGDRDLTAQIRKSIVGDKSLSTYAHNVKIVTRNGMVTLKGPVRSDDEKAAVEKYATQAAGDGKVTNNLTVAPKKG